MPEEDLIFGRNRHLFGGLAPSNMLKFTAAAESGGIRLTYQLPANTVNGTQVLCTVAGAVIRRKTGSYPTSEFDGTAVADVKTNGSYLDPVSAGTYYYAAFPYSTQEVFNRSKTANRVIGTSTKAATASLATFSLASDISEGQPQVTIATALDNPEDTSTGVVIRKSTIDYPVDENDGELVDAVMGDSVITDADVTLGETYYYSAFPFSLEDGSYDYDPVNRASVKVTGAPPGAMQVFEAQSVVRDDKPIVRLRVQLPPSLSEVEIGGVYIFRTVGDNEPDLAFELARSLIGDKLFTFVDEDVVANETYKYIARPYTSDDIFNEEEPDSNKAEVYVNPRWVYGFRYDPNDNYPWTCVHYLEDCDNKDFPAVTTTDTTKWGPIDIEAGEFFFPRPCYLDSNGDHVCYLDPNDYTKDEDSNSIVDEDGDFMLKWPTMYISIHGHEFRISNRKVDDTYTTKIEELYTAIYPTNMYGNSRPGWDMSAIWQSPQAGSNPDITVWSLFTFLYMLLWRTGSSHPPELELDSDTYVTGIGDKEGLMGPHHFLGMEALTSLTSTWISDFQYIPGQGLTDTDGTFVIPESKYGISEEGATCYAYADNIEASGNYILPIGDKGSSSTVPCALAIFAKKNIGTHQFVAMGCNGLLNLRTQATYADNAKDMPISRICYRRKEE